MYKNLKLLMVDDHPIIIEAYKNALMYSKTEKQTLKVDGANNCDDALVLLHNAPKREPYDVFVFDINIPPSKDKKVASGEDLALIARRLYPESKIIILTGFEEPYRIHNIINTIHPDGFLTKNDTTASEFLEAFKYVLLDAPYYSPTIQYYLNKSRNNPIYVDDTNRKILFLLSQGIKTKNLNNHIDLSYSAIEKRKKYLKEIFKVEAGGDEKLLEKAKKLGFL